MKKLILLATACFQLQNLQAQITIDSSDFRNWQPHIDTNCSIITVNSIPTQNVVLDYTSAQYLTVSLYEARADTDAQVPLASYSTLFNYVYPTSNSAQSNWHTRIRSGITSNGLQSFSEYTTKQAFSTTAHTGGVNDSIIVAEQKIIYAAPWTVVKFPLFYGETWSNNFFKTTDFIINIPAAGLNNAVFSMKTWVVETDSVTGWGKMRIRSFWGPVSDYMDVLAITTHATYFDTLYYNGAPITASMAQTIHIPQNNLTTGDFIAWYRNGHTMPLYHLINYGTAFKEVCMTDLPMPVPNGVSYLNNNHEIKIFPNPARMGEPLFLEFQSADPKMSYTYELVNTMGQSVSAARLNLSGNKTQVDLNKISAPGNFFMRVYGNDKVITTRQINVQP